MSQPAGPLLPANALSSGLGSVLLAKGVAEACLREGSDLGCSAAGVLPVTPTVKLSLL